jgi:chemotaxis signal transduction protein
LGFVAEHVSDLTRARPEQVVATPVSLPQAPYLDAIVQTDQGIVQLIAVDKLRDAWLRSSSVGQATALHSKSEPAQLTT